MYIDHEGTSNKKSPPLNDIEDLSDTRILLRFINSIFPQTFTPEVLLNDRLKNLRDYWQADHQARLAINHQFILIYYNQNQISFLNLSSFS